ncbi:MAG: hypothetical protein U9Q16_01085 [Patescibacteria group bacterium]|nr:hypothetical protein [Patescibacteria group bacterium]
MEKRNMPNSLRKFARKEKARIRKQVFEVKEQDKLISEMYKKIKK